jgi:hypothetical protein
MASRLLRHMANPLFDVHVMPVCSLAIDQQPPRLISTLRPPHTEVRAQWHCPSSRIIFIPGQEAWKTALPTVAANTSIKSAGGVSDKDTRALAPDMRTTSEFIVEMRKPATEVKSRRPARRPVSVCGVVAVVTSGGRGVLGLSGRSSASEGPSRPIAPAFRHR